MTLTELEAEGLGPKDTTKEEWVEIMRAHMRELGQSEENGTLYALYADYEEYWEQNQ